MNRIISHLLIISLLALAACGDERTEYFPLEPGRYWRYDMSYTTMDGTFDGVYAVENLAIVQDDGETLYVRRLLDGSVNYFQITPAGILLKGREKTLDLVTSRVEEPRYIFKFPLKKGTSWQTRSVSKLLIKTGPPQKTEFHIRAPLDITASIESMTDTIRVPAGVFEDCMRVTFSGSNFYNAGNYVGMTVVDINETNWYAPGVGLVKSVRKETTTSKALHSGELIMELESYR